MKGIEIHTLAQVLGQWLSLGFGHFLLVKIPLALTAEDAGETTQSFMRGDLQNKISASTVNGIPIVHIVIAYFVDKNYRCIKPEKLHT